MADEYARHDVVLKLSRVEGMFAPPLEGFHRGATCVVTPVTGHDEYVEHGVNGLVVHWDDERGTARALDLLARDDAAAAPAAHQRPGDRARRGRRGTSQTQLMALALRRIAAQPSPDPSGAARALAGRRAAVPGAQRRRGARPRAAADADGPHRAHAGPRPAADRAAHGATRSRDAEGRMSDQPRARDPPPLARAARPARHVGRRGLPRGEGGHRTAARAGRRRSRPRAGHDGGPLDVAIVVPFFREGSGGHMTIANLVRGLERRGHRCSLWIDDPGRRCAGGPAGAAANLRAWFGPFAADVHYGFDGWRGADVVVATGWQTVARVLTLPGARGPRVPRPGPRAGVLRHQRRSACGRPTATATACTRSPPARGSSTSCASSTGCPRRTSSSASTRDLYRPRSEVARREDVVLFYARASTPRRAVPIVQVALGELKRRRPQTCRSGSSATAGRPALDYEFRDLGVVSGDDLARLYSRRPSAWCCR